MTPERLVSTSQLISSGYTSSSASVASNATSITISQGGFVNQSTNLGVFNGGLGVQPGSIKLTDASGNSETINLSGATSVQDVLDAINSGSGANITASVKGDSIQLTDHSGGSGTLHVQNVGGGQTATNLGLTSLSSSGNTYTGQDIYNLGQNLPLSALNDGNGVSVGSGNDFTITSGSVSFGVNLSSAQTVGDVLNLINNNTSNTGGKVIASISGNSIVLSDSQGSDPITVTPVGGSQAASNLGLTNGSGSSGVLTGNDILGSLNTVLLTTLHGGSETATPTPGTITINGTNIDLSGATTLQDVINGINNAGITGVTAAVNTAGNGISLNAVNVGSLSVSDTSGNLASFLNIAGTQTGNNITVNSGSLHAQYVNVNTLLSNYGSSSGVPLGSFQITDGNGKSTVINLAQSSATTIGDVIQEINTAGLAVSARINDTGDGILLQNLAGSGSVSVSDLNGGTTAKSLGLLQTPDSSGNVDGSLAVTIEVPAGTSLSSLATLIQQSGAPVTASVLNDGTSGNPYRLNLTSTQSGSAGQLLIDTGATNLSLATVSKGQDAVALYGTSGSGTSPIQVVSSTNTFTGLVPGVSVVATNVASAPVTITVAQDTSSVATAMQNFVSSYNSIVTYISSNSQYSSTANTLGLLFADPTANTISTQLANFANSKFGASTDSVRSLGQLGVTLGTDGTLTLNTSQLQSLLQSDPTSVIDFLTNSTNGLAARFQKVTNTLTTAGTGVISTRSNVLSSTILRQTNNIATLNAQLKAQQTMLFNQFYAMETALSSLKTQQSALSALTGFSTSSSSSGTTTG